MRVLPALRTARITPRLLRRLLAAAAALPLLLPGTVSAASVQVCAAAGDACSKFMDKYINPVITTLSIMIGVAAVISYLLAAIQYSSAGDDPGGVSKAKDRAFKTTIGLLAYLFFFALLNYLVPGGLF
ncbi:MAG TPA: hypothetical protein VLF71_06065 [Candidatus Saccharimonadales bacterium]|nr:hypothetical protein [Candidatus Saccharimonadales bacterium]